MKFAQISTPMSKVVLYSSIPELISLRSMEVFNDAVAPLEEITGSPVRLCMEEFASIISYNLDVVSAHLSSYSDEFEDQWSFSPKETASRHLFADFVSRWESWFNDNCFDQAWSRSEHYTLDKRYSGHIQIYPGDRDSFGWLSGVTKLTIENGKDSVTLMFTWG